jgi:sucrose phosphorylase
VKNPDTHTSHVFSRMNYLLGVRAQNPAFHPNGEQRVLAGHPAVFGLLRRSPDELRMVVALINVSDQNQEFEIRRADLGGEWPESWVDSLSDRIVACGADAANVALTPYEVLWLEPSE